MSVRHATSLVYVASLNLEERLVGSLVKCCKVSLPSAVGGENLADSGWIAVVGVAVGGSLTAAVTLVLGVCELLPSCDQSIIERPAASVD